VRRASPQRYMAFLSYSHQDAAIADWLHETLEEFKVPPQLIGRLTDQGPVPKKLAPIFRDRQELAAAADLSDEIEEAIAASRFLIILCSPAAAKSRWINEEIGNFKREVKRRGRNRPSRHARRRGSPAYLRRAPARPCVSDRRRRSICDVRPC